MKRISCSVLLFMLLVLLAPLEAALAAQPCLPEQQPGGAVMHCDSASSTNHCDKNHASACCQAACLLKARTAQTLIVLPSPAGGLWSAQAPQMPTPGHVRQILHPPAI